MRFIRFFLIIFLFLQPLRSAQEEFFEQSLFERAKASIVQAASLSKQGISFIFSNTAELQWCFLIPEIFKQLVIGGLMHDGMKSLEAITPSVPLDQLPISIKDALIDMNAQDIPVKYIDGDGALAAFSRTIFIGKDLLLSSDSILRFVVGHEIAHIQRNHQIKAFVLLILCLGGFICGNKIVQKIEDQLKTTDEDTYTYTSLACVKNMISLVVKNPVIAYISVRTLQAYFARSWENESDFLSATTLNCAQGGVDYFNETIIKEQVDNVMIQESVDSFWILYFRFFSFLGSTLNWKAHPSLQTRIDYLLPLAQQQAATII